MDYALRLLPVPWALAVFATYAAYITNTLPSFLSFIPAALFLAAFTWGNVFAYREGVGPFTSVALMSLVVAASTFPQTLLSSTCPGNAPWDPVPCTPYQMSQWALGIGLSWFVFATLFLVLLYALHFSITHFPSLSRIYSWLFKDKPNRGASKQGDEEENL